MPVFDENTVGTGGESTQLPAAREARRLIASWGIDTPMSNRHARTLKVMTDGTSQRDQTLRGPMNANGRHHSTESRISKIARRAHEIYQARGGEHGKALEDWLQAEREIDAEMDAERANH
jgi:Protein of unknown function (DUF2934)